MKRWLRIGLAGFSAVALLAASPAQAGLAISLGEWKPEQERRTNSQRLADLDALTARLQAMPQLSTAIADGQQRHALVIGIDDYEGLADLRKAVGDSKTIADTLQGLGFTVTRAENLGIDAFDETLDDFYESVRAGDIAFVFFAGHGVAMDGVNYLLPADMPELRSIKSSRLERYAVDAGRIVDELKARGAELAFVVLDACRNNPFPQDDQRGGTAMAGLQRMMPKEGAFVIYSAGIGQTALDRLGADDADANSVFTRKFWHILNTPGLPVVEIAKRTQVEVAALAATVEHEQAPAYYDQVVGQFYFQPPRPKLYGLTIGIDDYGDERLNLRGAVNDARLIADALRMAGAERVETLVDYNAHPAFIEYVWRDLLAEAQPGDTIALTFSGNGAQEPDASESPEADGLREFLLVNGPGALRWDTQIGEVTPARKITDGQLTGWMAEAAEKNVNVLLLMDGCHGGGMLNREFANVSFIGASQEDQVATERLFDGKRYGLASYVFANAISGAGDFNGDGFVTQQELFAYVDENVYRMNYHQVPQLLPPIDGSAPGLALLNVTDQNRARMVDLSGHWSKEPEPERETGRPTR
ncbi:MAG: caspase family protein [Rhizobiaceae bacterium]|nr:caspase family protein [Rhizobiaceae bacterium]